MESIGSPEMNYCMNCFVVIYFCTSYYKPCQGSYTDPVVQCVDGNPETRDLFICYTVCIALISNMKFVSLNLALHGS